MNDFESRLWFHKCMSSGERLWSSSGGKVGPRRLVLRANLLGTRIKKLDENWADVDEIPTDLSDEELERVQKELEEIVEIRAAQASALALGLNKEISPDDGIGTLEAKIIEVLPSALENRGVVPGNIIQMNFDPTPEVPHKVINTMNGHGPFFAEIQRVNSAERPVGEIDVVNAVALAIYATPYKELGSPSYQR
jgi:hypothetical protein